MKVVVVSKLEKKKETGIQEQEDNKRILELNIHIKQEKEAIENEIIRLHNYEKLYNEELNYGKPDSGLQGDSKKEITQEEINPISLGELNKETSVNSGQGKPDAKNNLALTKKPSIGRTGSKTNVSPPKRPTTGTSTSVKPKNRPTSKATTTQKPKENK